MKRWITGVTACCLVAVLALAGCSNSASSSMASSAAGSASSKAESSMPDSSASASGSAGMANPMESYDTLGEAGEAAGIEAAEPTVLPEGYSQKSIDVIDGKTLQVIYANGDDKEITYRTAKGSGDISGDYNSYEADTDFKVDGTPVAAKGDGDMWALALWEDGGMAYSLHFDEPVSEGELADVILSI